MGRLIVLPVKKTYAKPRRRTLSEFQQRARLLQKSIQTACVTLTQEYKLLQREKRINYQQCSEILKITHNIRQQADKWSKIIYDDERLPFAVYIRRYPLLSSCFHIQQQLEELTLAVKAACVICIHPYAEEIQMCQNLIKMLAALLESERKISSEIFALLDQIRFHEQQRHII